MKETGARVRALRLTLGASQEEFAKRLGVTRSRLGNWEQGQRLLPVHVALDLSDNFQVPLDFIYKGSVFVVNPDLYAKLRAVSPEIFPKD